MPIMDARQPGLVVRLATGLLLSWLVSGCAVFLPRHPNSLDSKGEAVTVTLLDPLQFANTGKCDAYRKAFETRGDSIGCCSLATPSPMTLLFTFIVTKNGVVIFETTDQKQAKLRYQELTAKAAVSFAPAALAVPAAALATEFAVDFVKKELEEEATRYSAQFQGQAFFDDFWVVAATDIENEHQTVTRTDSKGRVSTDLFAWGSRETTYRQRYCGIEITRTTKAHPKATPAFRLILGLAPSKDQQFLLAAPLSAQTQAAKAKVLDDRWWTQVFLYGFALDAGDEVETHVDAEILANWRTQNPSASDAMYRSEKLLALSFDVPRQNLDKGFERVVGENRPKRRLPKRVGGWFGAVPRSFNELGVPVGEGTGTVRVLVTERDPSNAKQNLQKAATELANSKDKIVEQVSDGAKKALDKH
ncbi:MAG: hypothetical protein SF182_26130 [Deltaproteobacteria bacterium]|nr:hypothetical protein [Deltaproteobacteria bacterium]